MAKSLERHAEELLRMTNEERASQGRSEKACMTLPAEECDRVLKREDARQAALDSEAQEMVKEQLDRG